MAKMQVLIVKDEHIVALDVRNQLETLGYHVVGIVARGKDAIERAIALRPDLVLMDIRLRGEMDGVEAAQRIRTRLDIPVVYLTAHADPVTLERCKITEPYGYVPKPFEERDLHTAIEMALYRHRAERTIRESEQWLGATLQSIGAAVIATDAQGCLRFMNPVAQALTGWMQEEAVGEPSARVFRTVDASTGAPLPDPVAQVLARGQAVRVQEDALLVSRSGERTPISDNASPIRDARGQTTGAVLVFQDITAQKATQEQMERYADELESRNRDLDAFAHTVAHDIKDPLNTMMSCASMLRENHQSLSDNQKERLLDILVQTGCQACSIVDELLLLSSVRDAKAQLEPLPMGEIVARAQRRLALLQQEYRAEVIVPKRWPVALGYGPWVEEVWVNYMSNAIKYGGTPPRLELGASQSANGTIRFWVQDNGPGIRLEQRTQLFAPFARLGQVRATGHGLGLSIVRRIVEKLGGQVDVESAAGSGSVFAFVLPAA